MNEHEVASLISRVETAVAAAIGRARPELADVDPLVRRSQHADFQSNAALAVAKRAHAMPAEIAAEVSGALLTIAEGGEREFVVSGVSVSGPGFLNLTLPDVLLWRQVAARLADDRLGVGRPENGTRTVVDYSAPNIAKEMHVGHLRGTIIGDCLVRVLDFLGADVIRQNHLGDWGTQFGMLIQYLDEHPEAPWHHEQLDEVAPGMSTVSALDGLYRAARATFETDTAFAERSRARVVALQAGDPATMERWREIVAESELAFRGLYERLGVLLTPQDSVGESFYNRWLAEVTAELVDAGIAVESEGALVVYSEEVFGPDGRPATLMVRKNDGAYGYDTTDLATIRYRVRDLKADRVLYLVDARQSLHFRLIFEAARRAGWLPSEVDVEHVAFGAVLGPEGKPFKTRTGDTVKLSELLDSAVEHSRAVILQRAESIGARPLEPAELDAIAEQAGIGAVKYADLSTSRTKDYLFDVERMVSSVGDTGVYLQYAHMRIRSILRKAARSDEAVGAVDVSLPLHPAERELVLELDAFGDTLADVARTLEPHRLCARLYDIARALTGFYDDCPVVTAEEPVRGNRIALCRLAARTLRQGLELLGVAAPERM